MLLISDIVSSSPDLVVGSVSSYPLAVSPGSSIDLVIQFQPTGPGATLSENRDGLHAVLNSAAALATRRQKRELLANPQPVD